MASPPSPVTDTPRLPATAELIAALPDANDCAAFGDALERLQYNRVLHSFYRTLPVHTIFKMALWSPICCQHLDTFAALELKISVRDDNTDLLAKLPWELLYPILCDLSFKDRVCLAQTSSRNYRLSGVVLHDSIATVLRRYKLCYPGVRLMQTVTGALISGSFIPSVIHNGQSFHINDLDFYAPYGQGWEVLLYFVQSAGYSSDDLLTNYDALPGLGRIRSARLGDLKINVIESRTQNARDAVLLHHSTIVMGTVCAEKVWLAYPALSHAGQALMTRHTLLIHNDQESRMRAWVVIRKYVSRGFTFVFEHGTRHICGQHYSCPVTLRTSLDGGCLKMYLPPSPFGPADNHHESSWSLGGAGCRHGGVLKDTTPLIMPVTSHADAWWRSLVRSYFHMYEPPVAKY